MHYCNRYIFYITRNTFNIERRLCLLGQLQKSSIVLREVCGSLIYGV